MKKQLICLLLVLGTSLSSFKKDGPKRIIFFGDSITQAGVGKTGYITKMTEMIAAQGLFNQYELIGAGIGGNKVYDLYLRHEEDVVAKNPHLVIIYIGINDVWHKTSSRTGTDADKFERFYNAENDGDLNAYSAIIKKIAKDNSVQLIDLRKAFMEYESKNNIENKALGILTSDRVHLNETGNQFLADTMWDVIKKL
jgi:lysophospholipase L1-like esterase